LYTVQQLQAMDYLLKKITSRESSPLFKKNIKLVVEINGSFWSGDFIQMTKGTASRLFIDDYNDLEDVRFFPDGSNAASPLKEIWDAFIAASPGGDYWYNPLMKISDLPLLFETLTRVLDRATIPVDASPFFPYLLNAKSLDGKMRLPFINLANEPVKLVSIIEAPE